MSLLNKSYTGTERCGLCRLQFPCSDSDSDLDLSGLDAWQCAFRAALCWDPNDESAVEITGLATISNIHDNQIDVPLTMADGRRNQTITIARRQQNIRKKHTGPTAFCFHNWCYLTLRWKVGSCTNSDIYRLARTLSLDSVACQKMYRDDCQSGSVSKKTLANLADDSSYSRPPLPILQLPIELRNSIWEYVGLRTAFSSFILVVEETSRLVRSLNCSSSRNMSLDQGAHLSFKMITVFGTAYIQTLDNEGSSTVIPGVVTRLSFAKILDGICAIKLFGTDWDTGWLGNIPNTGAVWYGTIQEIGTGVTCSYNDLYCTCISALGVSRTNQILWNQPDIPTSFSAPEAALFDFDRDIIGSSRPTLQNPQPRYFEYLSLFSGNEHINGLTVYLSGNGMVGLEAHFTRTSQLLGSRDGCSKYLPLDPSERIALTWLRIVNSRSPAFAAPTLTIQTTLGRIHSFGPYILPQLVMRNSQWLLQ
ncbi:hypothetical protein G7Y89_g14789 [Cudoniella acicularis]|uniref:Uncharacterized protein n=1 Tax=Cudoniella acicularis TaxID=354080 RepID=A0A8H4QYK8_9HELO|nr:hypothetical protein G7Y89_g14789 [Cudoniella acicularis]